MFKTIYDLYLVTKRCTLYFRQNYSFEKERFIQKTASWVHITQIDCTLCSHVVIVMIIMTGYTVPKY